MGWVKSLTSLHGRNCHFIFIYSTRGLQFISVQTACDIFGETNLHLYDIFIARRNCIASVCIIHTWSKGIAKQLCCLQSIFESNATKGYTKQVKLRLTMTSRAV